MDDNQNLHKPFINTHTLTFYDIDQLADVVKGASLEVHQLDKGKFHSDHLNVSLKKGMLDKGYYKRSTLTKGTFSQENMTFGFIHDTPKEGRLNGESMHKHDILLSNENGPLDYSLAADSHWSSFQFKREDFLKTGIELPSNDSIIYHLDMKTIHSFSHQLNAIFIHLQETEEAINSELLYNHILSLYAYAANQTTSLKYLKRSESFLLATKIYEYMHEHAAEPIQMIHLTQLTGKSERTVERIYKKHFGVTPYTYLKLHRLHLVRNALMKQEDLNAMNITQIAMENGFMHMGYFGSEYKKLFNETPTGTLEKKF